MNGTSWPVALQHYVDSVFNLTSFFLNVGLLYIVGKHTPERLRPYKNVIRVTCFADMVLSLVYFICQPVILLKKNQLIYVSNGFFSHRAVILDHCMLTAFGYAVFVNNIHIPVPFICRYLHLCHNVKPTGRALVAFSASLCTLSLISMYTTWHLMGQDRVFVERAVNQVSETGLFARDIRPYLFGSSFLLPEGARILRLHLGLFSLATVLAYGIVFFAQHRTLMKLRSLYPSMLSSTCRMHSDLNRALFALAICPMVTSALPLTFFLVDIFLASDAADGLFLCACTVLSSIAFCNPITTCLLIRPYRAALKGLFTIKAYKPKPRHSVTATGNARGQHAATSGSVNEAC